MPTVGWDANNLQKLPVWMQELMDREYFAIDAFVAFIAIFLLSISFSIVANMFYHLLAWTYIIELQPTLLLVMTIVNFTQNNCI
jgi:hypothetical protein